MKENSKSNQPVWLEAVSQSVVPPLLTVSRSLPLPRQINTSMVTEREERGLYLKQDNVTSASCHDPPKRTCWWAGLIAPPRPKIGQGTYHDSES